MLYLYVGEHISNSQSASSAASSSQTSSVHEQHYPGNQYYPGSQYYPYMTRSGGKSTDAEKAGRSIASLFIHQVIE